MVNADGTIGTYTANAGYLGTDSFQYTIVPTSNGGVSLPATITVNTALPSVENAVYTMSGTKPVTINLTAYVSDAQGPGVFNGGSVNILKGPSQGQATVNPGSLQITYTPAGAFVGLDTIEYTLTDANGVTSKPATLTIRENPRLEWGGPKEPRRL